MNTTEQMIDPKILEQLTPLAQQYGPFFFAVLFVLLVPFMGQTWFRGFLEMRIEKGQERDAALEVYKFYWKSGIVAGLCLVFFAVTWWFYVQNKHLQIEAMLRAEQVKKMQESYFKSRVITGYIKGINGDDVFSPTANSDYTLSVVPTKFGDIEKIWFVIVFSDIPNEKQEVEFVHVSKAKSRDASAGGEASRIRVCIHGLPRELEFQRGQTPQFNVSCGAMM